MLSILSLALTATALPAAPASAQESKTAGDRSTRTLPGTEIESATDTMTSGRDGPTDITEIGTAGDGFGFVDAAARNAVDLEFAFQNEGDHTWRARYWATDGNLMTGDVITLWVHARHGAVPANGTCEAGWCQIHAIASADGGYIRVGGIASGDTYCFSATLRRQRIDGTWVRIGTYLGRFDSTGAGEDCHQHSAVVGDFATQTPPSILEYENGRIRASHEWRMWALAKWGEQAAEFDSNGVPIGDSFLEWVAEVILLCENRILPDGPDLNIGLKDQVQRCFGEVGEAAFGSLLGAVDDGSPLAAFVIGVSNCVTNTAAQILPWDVLGAPRPSDAELKLEGKLFLASCVSEALKHGFARSDGVFNWVEYRREMYKAVAIEFFSVLVFSGGSVLLASLAGIGEMLDFIDESPQPPPLPPVSGWLWHMAWVPDDEPGRTVTAETADVLINLGQAAQLTECDCDNPPTYSAFSRAAGQRAIRDWLGMRSGDRDWVAWHDRVIDVYRDHQTDGMSLLDRAELSLNRCPAFVWPEAEACESAIFIEAARRAVVVAVGEGWDPRCALVDEWWQAPDSTRPRSDQPFYCGVNPDAGTPVIDDMLAMSTTSAEFSWTAVAGATSYQLGNCGSSTSAVVATTTATSATWSGMTAGADHCATVRAVFGSDTSAWSNDEVNLRMPGQDLVTQAPPAGTVQIRNRHFADKCVEVLGTSIGAGLAMRTCDGEPAQRFSFQPSDQGTWMIRHDGSSLCVEVQGWNRDNNAPLKLADCNWEANRKWHVLDTAGDFRRLRPQHNPAACMDTWVDASTQVVKQYGCHFSTSLVNQDWALEPLSTGGGSAGSGGAGAGSSESPPGHVVQLRAAHSGLCATLDHHEAWHGLSQQTCDGSDRQKFRFEWVRDGYLRLSSAPWNHCLEVWVDSDPDENGRDIRSASCPQAYRNEWELVANANGTFGIRTRRAPGGERYCIDVAGVSQAVGARLHSWSCHTGANQQWHLEVPASGGGGSTPPPAPTGLWVHVPAWNGEVTFSWSAVTEATWYEVRYRLADAEYGPDGHGEPDWQIFPGNATQATARQMHSDREHCWEVQAHDASGPLGTSDEQCGIWANGASATGAVTDDGIGLSGGGSKQADQKSTVKPG